MSEPEKMVCQVCEEEVDTSLQTQRICPICQGTYHFDCWEDNGGCAEPDCRTDWYSLDAIIYWCKGLITNRYRYRRPGDPTKVPTIPYFNWFIVITILLFILWMIFFHPVVFHGDALKDYSPT